MAVVLDTQAVIWHLSGSNEHSLTARLVVQTAERHGDDDVFVSAISLGGNRLFG
jgi:PIN domain nuclease of toxin-antitoxin system